MTKSLRKIEIATVVIKMDFVLLERLVVLLLFF